MSRLLLLLGVPLLSLVLGVGCGVVQRARLSSALEQYEQASPRVHLGMSPDEVLAILGPSQAGLPADQKRPPEQFVNSDGKRVAIYYFRSGWVADGRLTDDEVTPYVFIDGQLAGVGWTTIGGPRSYGQVPSKPPQTNVYLSVQPPE